MTGFIGTTHQGNRIVTAPAWMVVALLARCAIGYILTPR
jgi:hypothetical protein